MIDTDNLNTLNETVNPLDYGSTTQAPVDYPAETNQGWEDAKKNRWELLTNAYSGAAGFSNGRYLVPHRREEASSFKLRKIRARYANDFKSIINALVSPIFKEEAVRTFEGATEAQIKGLDTFLKTASRNSNNYANNMKTFARNSRKYDTSYILVSAPAEGVTNLSELSDTSKLPYLSHIIPSQVVEQTLNSDGVIQLISWCGTRLIDGKLEEIVTEYTLTSWRVYLKKTDKTIEAGKNVLGYVPVFPLWAEENEAPETDPNPMGLANSLGGITLRRYNLASIIDEIADGSAYPLLALVGDDGVGDLDLGINNALVLPTAGADAKYIQPDYAVLTTLYSTLYAGLTSEMYSSASVLYMRDAAQSAESRQMEGERTQEILGDFSNNISQVDRKVMNTVLDYIGLGNIEYSVEYTSNFGIRSMQQDLEAYEILKEDETISEPARKLVSMRIMRQLLQGVPEGELRMIEEDMQAKPEDVGTSNTDQLQALFEVLDGATTPAPPEVMAELVKRMAANVLPNAEAGDQFESLITEHYKNQGELI
jgi:hypothetical protein